jgi:hypothetical protein
MRFPARRAVLSGLGLALLAACGKKPDAGASAWEIQVGPTAGSSVNEFNKRSRGPM